MLPPAAPAPCRCSSSHVKEDTWMQPGHAHMRYTSRLWGGEEQVEHAGADCIYVPQDKSGRQRSTRRMQPVHADAVHSHRNMQYYSICTAMRCSITIRYMAGYPHEQSRRPLTAGSPCGAVLSMRDACMHASSSRQWHQVKNKSAHRPKHMQLSL